MPPPTLAALSLPTPSKTSPALKAPPSKEKELLVKLKSFLAILLTASLFCASAGATTVTATDGSANGWDFGGDLRLRLVGFVNLPSVAHDESPHTDYFRMRTRVWGKYTQDRFEAYLRLGNEFRHFFPDEYKGAQRFPDVTFIDQLYVTGSDLFDGLLDVRLGRQNMEFGNRRIIGDGTGSDSSRTSYFDALRLTFDFDNGRTLDAFAMYTARHDWLPTLGRTHDPRHTGNKSYDCDVTGYNHTEYGAGLYYTDKSYAPLPWEAYYVWKTENGRNSYVIQDGSVFTTHTFGMRLLPQFSKTLSGEFESAIQFGDDKQLALLAHAGLTYAPDWKFSPRFTAAVTYLSGDRSGPRGRHAWHAVFNRQTHFGDLVSCMYLGEALTNLIYPHVMVQFFPSELTQIDLQAGPLFAPVAEERFDGGDYGHYRGVFAQAIFNFRLGEYFFESGSLSSLNLNIIGEVMSKSSDWFPGEDSVGYNSQIELTYTF